MDLSPKQKNKLAAITLSIARIWTRRYRSPPASRPFRPAARSKCVASQTSRRPEPTRKMTECDQLRHQTIRRHKNEIHGDSQSQQKLRGRRHAERKAADGNGQV